jgi:nicotinamide riboside kinase
MTAAWAEMLFGSVPDELLGYPKAEQYLLFAPSTPWLADGTRMFGSEAERKRFAAIAEQVLVSAGVSYREIGGDWAERELRARRAIDELG